MAIVCVVGMMLLMAACCCAGWLCEDLPDDLPVRR